MAEDIPTNGRRSKVHRVIEEYDLDGMDDLLVRSWRGEGDRRRSLRELADHLNRELLAASMDDAGVDRLEGELENTYRLLTNDEVTAADRTQAETKLSRAGIDIERLRRDFVSHQAVHTYLRDHRDIEPPDDRESPAESVQNRSETIQRLRNRLVAVTDRSLRSLRTAGHISQGSFDVLASVTVHCNECGATHDVVELLQQRGCDCRSE